MEEENPAQEEPAGAELGGTSWSAEWGEASGAGQQLGTEAMSPEEMHVRVATEPSQAQCKSRPYSCSDCEKSFRQSAHLVQHQRIHTGQKPYQCSECGKSFVLSCNLIDHQRIHTGEQPYQCGQCGKSFIRSSHLFQHQQPHRRAALPVHRVQEASLPQGLPDEPPAHAHRGAALCMHRVQEGLHQHLQAHKPLACPQQGAALPVHGLREGLWKQLCTLGAPEKALQGGPC